MLLRDKDVKDYKTKAEKLQSQMTLLRNEVMKLESEVEHKNSAIHALKEQSKYYKQSHEEGKKYKEQAEVLKKKLNNINDVQMLLSSTNDEADELLSSTDDREKLVTYISALKRELTIGLKHRKEYRIMIRQLKQDMNAKIIENNTLKEQVQKAKSMEEIIQSLESEICSLKKKISENSKNLSRNESNELNDSDCSMDLLELSKERGALLKPKKIFQFGNELDEENEENCSINSKFKINDFKENNKRKLPRLNSGTGVPSNSILAKKPRLAHNPTTSTGLRNEFYSSDGLGGYAKVENFPTGTSGAIKKKFSLKSRTNSQTNNLNNQNKIDTFIDLTS
ncbi:hypothetical protein PV327_009560 [Microctonus hyperodae]|uniref:Uncharacterized protein n=1 Tax=Microctonus hyperodae TaxID=165561 RepID=A0AA39EZT9_MICHY|nr:hypothetical protein PV327_009560 [Microctonus hyperodae]